MEQRSKEWFDARLGRVTASMISDVMAKTKSGYSASRENYMSEKICEILTGRHIESYTSKEMQWGTDTEPLAIEEYENRTFSIVEKAGFIVHPEIEKSGASPDGLIGENGLIEVKCPNTSTHINFLLDKKIPSKYQLQMQFQLTCTHRDWCDFVSFDPRLPDDMKILIIRVFRDEKKIQEIEFEVKKFLDEMHKKIENLKKISLNT